MSAPPLPRRTGKNYTDAQKIAYYKKLARGGRKRTTTRRRRAPARRRHARGGVNIIQGYGDYTQSIGGKIGMALGGRAGHGIQTLAGKLMGFGDYSVAENTIYMGGMQPPEIVNSVNNGEVIVRHREYLGDLKSSIDFNLQSYYLNPGLSATFPWLCTMSSSFEEYRWRGMVFEFISTSSDAVLSTSANSSLGTVNLATQYNSVEPLFKNKKEMLNHEFANSCKPSENILHPIECKMSRTPVTQLYVREGPVPPNADERLYDLGVFQIATEGQQVDGGTLGELWCTYEVGLFKARLATELPVDAILTDHFQLSDWSGTSPLGTTTVRTPESSLKGTILNGSRYDFPPDIDQGKFLVTIIWRGSTGVTINYPLLSWNDSIDMVPMWSNNTLNSSYSPPQGMVSSVNCQHTFCAEIVGRGASFNFGTSGTLPGGTNLGSDFVITQIDDDIPNPVFKKTKEISTTSCSDEEDYVKVKKTDLQKLIRD